jgi:sporulation protein YlmC with PRC-barrel domain
MRLSDLLGSEVFEADGTSLGHVRDVRLVADGRTIGAFGSALRVHGLVVGRGSVGARLGLGRSQMRGPWLLKAVFGRRPRHLVDWTEVSSLGLKTVHLAQGASPHRL